MRPSRATPTSRIPTWAVRSSRRRSGPPRTSAADAGCGFDPVVGGVMSGAAGLLLAAGAGRRMGQPKALVRHPAREVTLLEHALGVLREAGCRPVVAVLGARAEEA